MRPSTDDESALRVFPLQMLTAGLIVIGFVAFTATWLFDETVRISFYQRFGFVPAILFQTADYTLAAMTLFSAIFLHGDWLQLIVNLLFLWIFGCALESGLGHFRFIALYLIAGAAGILVHATVNQASLNPVLGSSGALTGLLVAYLLRHPKTMRMTLDFPRRPVTLFPHAFILLWVILQIFEVVTMRGAVQTVSWAVHFGGAAAAVLLAIPFVGRTRPRETGDAT